MENNDRPVDFDRLRLNISQLFPCSDEPPLLKDQLNEKIKNSLGEDRFQCLLPRGEAFLTEIQSFFKDIVTKQEDAIESCKNIALIQQRTWNSCRFTDTQVNEFLKVSLTKYTKGELHSCTRIFLTYIGTLMYLKTHHPCVMPHLYFHSDGGAW